MIESSAFVEDNFNDFLFWRRPLPPLEGGNPCRHSPAQPATYTSSVSQSRASSRQEHEEDSTFNDFFFWRRPLSPLPQSVLSPIVAPTPGSPTPALSPPLRASPPPLGVGAEEEIDESARRWVRPVASRERLAERSPLARRLGKLRQPRLVACHAHVGYETW